MTHANRIDRITDMLNTHLAPEHLVIRDDSGAHSGHGNVPPDALHTHLHISIKAVALSGKSRVEQHRQVMALIQPEFERGLHALQIEVLR